MSASWYSTDPQDILPLTDRDLSVYYICRRHSHEFLFVVHYKGGLYWIENSVHVSINGEWALGTPYLLYRKHVPHQSQPPGAESYYARPVEEFLAPKIWHDVVERTAYCRVKRAR
jgi:hypothetical protein